VLLGSAPRRGMRSHHEGATSGVAATTAASSSSSIRACAVSRNDDCICRCASRKRTLFGGDAANHLRDGLERGTGSSSPRTNVGIYEWPRLDGDPTSAQRGGRTGAARGHERAGRHVCDGGPRRLPCTARRPRAFTQGVEKLLGAAVKSKLPGDGTSGPRIRLADAHGQGNGQGGRETRAESASAAGAAFDSDRPRASTFARVWGTSRGGGAERDPRKRARPPEIRKRS